MMEHGPNGEEPAIKVHLGAACVVTRSYMEALVAGRRAHVRGGASVACLAAYSIR